MLKRGWEFLFPMFQERNFNFELLHQVFSACISLLIFLAFSSLFFFFSLFSLCGNFSYFSLCALFSHFRNLSLFSSFLIFVLSNLFILVCIFLVFLAIVLFYSFQFHKQYPNISNSLASTYSIGAQWLKTFSLIHIIFQTGMKNELLSWYICHKEIQFMGARFLITH